MSDVEYLESEIAEMHRVLEPLDEAVLEEWSPDWVMRESLRTRFNELQHEIELARGEFELTINFVGARVTDHSIDASFLANFISRFQAVVSAVSDEIMFGVYQGTRRILPPDVLDQSTMRIVATNPGSFELGIEGPRDRGVQLTIDTEGEELPIFDEATDRVFDVFESVEGDWLDGSLNQVIAALGSQRPAAKMLDLAQILASNGTLVTAYDRSQFKDAPREIPFTSTGARRIQSLLSATTRETVQISVEGTLTGVRWRNRTFDVEVAEGSDDSLPPVISGHIASELRQDIRSGRFDQPGVFLIERTTTKSATEDELAVSYRLVGLSP
jgi:hypothetical protein